MARFIFFSVPAHGHINPTIPLVTELVQRGNEVIYYAMPEFKDKIEKTGARFRAYDFHRYEQFHPSDNSLRLAETLLEASSHLLPQLIQSVRDEKVDCIIHDSLCLWGWMVAKALDLPAVCSTTTFAMNRAVINSMFNNSMGALHRFARMLTNSGASLFTISRKIRRLSKDYGVRVSIFSIFSNPSDLNIVYTTRELQPLVESFDERYSFVGPSISIPQDEDTFPWQKLDGRSVIYISLGTLRNKRTDFYRACIAALKESEYLVVMSVGKNIDISELGEAPENILVFDYVPQLKVLQNTRLFISHAGMNSVHESLYFGVPLLLLPQTEEQEFVARQVEAFGAGKVLRENDLEPEKLRGLVHTLLDDQKISQSAITMQKSLHATGGYKFAADKIEEFVKVHQHSPRSSK